MKILHVITSMNPKLGGVCQVLRNLNPYLIEQGINVEIVSLDNEHDDFGIHDNFVIHKLGYGKTSYQYQPKLAHWLNDNLSNYNYVIIHGLWQYPNFASYQSVKLLKKQNKKVPKVIIMPHGMLDPYFQKAPERRLKALRNEIVWALIERNCINNDVLLLTDLPTNSVKNVPLEHLRVAYVLNRSRNLIGCRDGVACRLPCYTRHHCSMLGSSVDLSRHFVAFAATIL